MSRRDDMDVLVVGGGCFGTSLAALLAGQGRRVRLWVRREDQAEEINTTHKNSRYLPDFELPENLEAVTDLGRSVTGTPLILMVVPSKSFRQVAKQVGDHLEGDQILVHATKGIEIATFKRMSQVLREETCGLKIGVLSGPNLSKEIMAGHPAGALLASRYREVVDAAQALFEGSRLRLYSGKDVIGTEVGGAFKNIIAVAAGLAAGLGFGDNTKALLITRGLSEMARFGVAVGADVFTFGGLAGIGDLMATCASPLSRNHQVGSRLAKGESMQEILDTSIQVAEGVPTTKAVHNQAESIHMDLPIVRAVYHRLYDNWDNERVVEDLMASRVGSELARLRYQ
jgi:glycerol-3-phosphate dehydrogenase (NAD(P)+)